MFLCKEDIFVAPTTTFVVASSNDEEEEEEEVNNIQQKNRHQPLSLTVRLESSVTYVQDEDENEIDTNDNNDDCDVEWIHVRNKNRLQEQQQQQKQNELLDHYNVVQIHVQMGTMSSSTFHPSYNPMDHFFKNNHNHNHNQYNHVSFLSSTSTTTTTTNATFPTTMTTGPAGLYIQVTFMENHSTKKLSSSLQSNYWKQKFIQLIHEMVGRRYIISSVGTSLANNPRLHRYIHVQVKEKEKEKELEQTNTIQEKDETIIVSTIIPTAESGSSSMLSSEGFVAFIKTWKQQSLFSSSSSSSAWKRICRHCYNSDSLKDKDRNSNYNYNNGSTKISLWTNESDALIWSNWMLGDTTQSSLSSRFRLSSLGRRSMFMEWNRNSFSLGLQYVLQEQQQLQVQQLSTVSSMKNKDKHNNDIKFHHESYHYYSNISVQDLLPPGLLLGFQSNNNIRGTDDQTYKKTMGTNSTSATNRHQKSFCRQYCYHNHDNARDGCNRHDNTSCASTEQGIRIHFVNDFIGPYGNNSRFHQLYSVSEVGTTDSTSTTTMGCSFLKNYVSTNESTVSESMWKSVSTASVHDITRTCFTIKKSKTTIPKRNNVQNYNNNNNNDHETLTRNTEEKQNSRSVLLSSTETTTTTVNSSLFGDSKNMNGKNQNDNMEFMISSSSSVTAPSWWEVHTHIWRYGGQDGGPGTVSTILMNHHKYCPVIVTVTQPFPNIIRPIWSSLYGTVLHHHDQKQNHMYNDYHLAWSDLEYSNVDYIIQQQQHHTSNNNNKFIVLTYKHTIMPQSTLEVSFDYKPVYLSIESFPGDANRGFDIPPVKATFQLQVQTSTAANANNSSTYVDNESTRQQQQCQREMQWWQQHHPSSTNNQNSRSNTIQYSNYQYVDPVVVVFAIDLYSNPLLILSPLPDMSMPFNVLSFTCTLYAFIIGSMLNLLVKKGNSSISKKLHQKPLEATTIATTLKRKLNKVMQSLFVPVFARFRRRHYTVSDISNTNNDDNGTGTCNLNHKNKSSTSTATANNSNNQTNGKNGSDQFSINYDVDDQSNNDINNKKRQ